MAVDMRARYFGEFDEGAVPSFGAFPQGMPQPSAFEVMPMSGAAQPMMPSFSAFPQATPQPSPFEVMPMSGAAPIMETPREAAVMPMTQEAAPFDLSSLAGLDLSGLGGFGGGRMGGVIQDPNTQYITAPVSNKGNPTGRMGGNVFAVTPDQPVRLVDLRTNTIVFEGTGAEAARKATEVGQSLTDSLGRKASYNIQTADPSGAYTTVANEKANKSTLGTLGQIVGTALPIVVSLVPGLQFAGPVLSAAIAGGAGAAMAGRDPVKGAIMGGLSAGGGQVLSSAKLLGPAFTTATGLGTKAAAAIGTGLGSTAGGLATGQNLKSSLLGGVASGALSYVAPSIQNELGISTKSGSIFRGGNTSASTGGADSSAVYGGPNAEIVVNAPAFSTPNVKLGGFKTPAQNYLRDARADDVINPETRTPYNTGYDGDLINVTGTRIAPGTNLGGFTGNPAVDRLLQPGAEELGDEDLIKVTGTRVVPGTNLGGFTGNPAVDRLLPTTTEFGDTDLIKVTGRETIPGTGGLNLAQDLLTDTNQKSEAERKAEEERKKKLSVADALALLNLVGGIAGGGGGGGGGGTPGSQAINPIFSAKLPTPGEGGAFKVGGLDYRTPPATDAYRYAMGPAMDIRAGTDLSKATSPYAGYGPGTLGEETFKRVTGMSHGGAMGYARGSSRDSFAVEGPGTGRSDDIPAVLSDGEYVIDAETVALLGDGSSKAGAKKLDEMRVKLRKHKGRNLAKGKFSVNAKRPEKYLSGGRT
jgi:hypothetical protein